MPIYMNVGGQRLACEEVHFDGVTGSHNNSAAALRLQASPTDLNSGSPLGRRRYGELQILISLNPRAQGLPPVRPSQVLHGVQLEFTKTSPNGKEQVQHTVNLGQTKVVGFQPQLPSKHGNVGGLRLEYLEVEYVYRQITWTFSNGGKVFRDDWH